MSNPEASHKILVHAQSVNMCAMNARMYKESEIICSYHIQLPHTGERGEENKIKYYHKQCRVLSAEYRVQRYEVTFLVLT